MHLIIWFLILIIQKTTCLEEVAALPRFRILAPEFVCPEDEQPSAASNVDQSVIRFQMASGASAHIEWMVRWRSHGPLSQRGTLLLWRATRRLEADLNCDPPEPYTFVINNAELLAGVDYLFNVTAVGAGGVRGQSGNFSIAFEDGRRSLNLHDDKMAAPAGDKMSVLLLGSETAFAHAPYELRARVAMCRTTHDYHFVWSVDGLTDPSEQIDVEDQTGSRLLLPAGTLRGGHDYDVSCQLRRTSDDYLITTAGMFVAVLRRGLELRLGCDELATSVRRPLRLAAALYNHDNAPPPFAFEWSCTFNGDPCSSFESNDTDEIYLESGFPDIGEYKVSVSATSGTESTEASMLVTVLEASLPILQVEPMRRLLNEGSTVELVAEASNIAPSCSLAWYFASTDQMASNTTNDTCEYCEHGEPLGQTITVHSTEEAFLSELADFTNTTERREVRARLPAAAGRARLLATCGCSEAFGCETQGAAYADLAFRLNASPRPADVMVSPASGAALETVFRLSTLAVEDQDLPVRYTFHYTFGNSTDVMLGSYINHVADETVLPYIEEGVSVSVTSCDVWGACGRSAPTPVIVAASKAVGDATLLADAASAQLRRCELDQLQSLAASALLTLADTEQTAELERYTTSLVGVLKAGAGEACIQQHIQLYHSMLNTLGEAGLFQQTPKG